MTCREVNRRRRSCGRGLERATANRRLEREHVCGIGKDFGVADGGDDAILGETAQHSGHAERADGRIGIVPRSDLQIMLFSADSPQDPASACELRVTVKASGGEPTTYCGRKIASYTEIAAATAQRSFLVAQQVFGL